VGLESDSGSTIPLYEVFEIISTLKSSGDPFECVYDDRRTDAR